MLTRVIIACVGLFSINSYANEWVALHDLLPKGTQFSYLVHDVNSQTLLTQHQSSVLRTPASLQKLLTATAAKLHLGSDFRYRTTLTGPAHQSAARTYLGDIRLNFVGDPTLLRADLRSMIGKLKSAGIRKIEGDFVVNDGHFNGYQWSNGQPWNDLSVCYTSPAHAIVVNRNCVQGNLSKKTAHANKATLFIPRYEPITVSADVDIVTKAQRKASFCDLEITRNSHNNYHLWGCMVPRKRAFPLSIAVNDPFHYSAQIIASELQQLGISLTGEIRLQRRDEQVPAERVFASHQSESLDVLLETMMKKSDNLIADSLFKTLGASYFKRPGNYRNGGQALKAILLQQGIDLENAYLADGSGLSRHNLMSADLFMKVLRFVYQHDQQLNLLSSLSVAGVDGTLRYHPALRAEQFKGKVMAKTGSMKGVANLVGVAKTAQGDRLFVLMLNGYQELPATANNVKRRSDAPKHRFTHAFFDTLLNTP